MLEGIASSALGRSSYRVKYGRFGGPQVYGTATISTGPDGVVRLWVDGPKPDSFVIEDLKQHGMSDIRLTLRQETDQPFKLALLSWAFVHLFRTYGYTFALGRSSRPVRRAILEGTIDPLGKAFCFSVGPWPAIVPPLDQCVVMAETQPIGSGNARFYPIGVGATAGPVVICMPLADDEEAARVKSLESLAEDDGSFSCQVIPVRFRELFDEAAGVTFLDQAHSYFLDDEAGGRLAVISVSPATAAESLAAAQAPRRTRRRSPNSKHSRHDGWERELPALPHQVSAPQWAEVFGQDLDDRLRQFHLPTLPRDALAGLENEEQVLGRLGSLGLPVSLRMHVMDTFRLFVEHRPALEAEETGATGKVQRTIERILRVHALDGRVSYSFNATALDSSSRIGSFAALLYHLEFRRVLGPFYTVSTLMEAISEEVARWPDIRMSRDHVDH